MVIVRLVNPGLIPDPTDSFLWGVKYCDHCENIFFNSSLDLKFSFIIDPIEIVEFSVRNVLDILCLPPSS